MNHISVSANHQYLDLIRHYLQEGRDRSVELLDQALGQAREIIERNPAGGRDYPSVYRAMVWQGVKWVKVHRYWFSYTTEAEPTIFNIIYEASDIPGRAISPDDPTTRQIADDH